MKKRDRKHKEGKEQGQKKRCERQKNPKERNNEEESWKITKDLKTLETKSGN